MFADLLHTTVVGVDAFPQLPLEVKEAEGKINKTVEREYREKKTRRENKIVLCRPETGYCIRQNLRGGGGGGAKIVLNRPKTVYIARCCTVKQTKQQQKLKKRERERDGGKNKIVLCRPETVYCLYLLNSSWHHPSDRIHHTVCIQRHG